MSRRGGGKLPRPQKNNEDSKTSDVPKENKTTSGTNVVESLTNNSEIGSRNGRNLEGVDFLKGSLFSPIFGSMFDNESDESCSDESCDDDDDDDGKLLKNSNK